MNELIQKFRNHLGRKEYKQLEDVWLELLEINAPLDKMLELAELTKRHAPTGKTELLLWVLSDMFKQKRNFREQLIVLKQLLKLHPDETKLADELAECFRHLYSRTNELERLLQKSGLGYGQPVKPALATLEKYLALVPGAWVFDSERGPGKIEQLDLLLDRIVIRFLDKSKLTSGINSVYQRLHTIPSDGYFSQLETNQDALMDLATRKPAELLRLYLRDTGRPAAVKDLKSGLSDLVKKDAWDKFWGKARKDLTQDSHIVIRTGPSRTFQWSDEPVKKSPHGQKSRKAETIAISDSDLENISETEILEFYEKLTNFSQKKRFLDRLKTIRADDWFKLVPKFFIAGTDRRIRTMIEKELSRNRPALWQKLQDRILTSYHQNPSAFVWILENWNRLKLNRASGFISRAVDLLESTAFRRDWPRLRAALGRNNDRLMRSAIQEIDQNMGRSLLNRINDLRSLQQYRKDEITKLITARFPHLAKEKGEDIILSSKTGIEHARQELQNLVRKELPETAEEIARARAHGDLSENYEYKAAKEKQARLMRQINKLRADLSRAKPIARIDINISHVSVGCRVRLEDESGQTQEYTILGPWDSDPEHGIISYLAPFGQRLLNKKPGESLEMAGHVFVLKQVSTGI